MSAIFNNYNSGNEWNVTNFNCSIYGFTTWNGSTFVNGAIELEVSGEGA